MSTHKGTIVTLRLDKGFGFIRPSSEQRRGRDVFFHVRSLDAALPFDASLMDRLVCYVVEDDGRGGRAARVTPA